MYDIAMRSLKDRTDRDNPQAIIAQLVASWRNSLLILDELEEDDQLVAGYMVGAVLEIDDRDVAQDYEPLVAEIVDAIVSLETPLVSDERRSKLWAEVSKSVKALEVKYADAKAQ